MDGFGRTIDYLRISVTDRCNERCLYCMPEGYKGWERTTDHLTAAEITRLVRITARLGFRKFRLTGGEPLVRGDLTEIVREMAKIPGVETIALSTNGTRLAAQAEVLRQAGLRTVNISLDALDPVIYKGITGGQVADVLAGIRAAMAAKFESIKLNCVLLRGKNESELWPLTLFAAEHGLPLRFIELMPLSRTDVLTEENFLPAGEVMQRFREKDKLIPQTTRRLGNGPAKYYLLERTGALVGFIGALTNLNFCDDCNKIRLTADGKIRPCLGQHGEMDIRDHLRQGATDAELTRVFLEALANKPREHSFREHYVPNRPMTAIGG